MNDGGYHVRYDDEAGPVERPFALTDGRTEPAVDLDLVSLVRASGDAPHNLDPLLHEVLGICAQATAVAEIAARLHRPIVVAKILLSDLIQLGAAVRVDRLGLPAIDDTDPQERLRMLEDLLRGLRRIEV
ncbi:MAG TPA: DUF742 domain-containing protein [Pseudonocardiaceae bacterium]|nr:DUF742 domain-containing protein [Pseudonocardiaceae bacterium]